MVLARHFFCCLALFLTFSLFFADDVHAIFSKKNINVTFSSDDLEPFDINKKTEPEERTTFYSDPNANIDVNENGEPNLNMRF